MAETRRSAWRAALASVLRSSAWPSSLEPSGESRALVFASVKNWREKMMFLVVRTRMKRITCWKRSRLERVLSSLLEASADLNMKNE